AALGRVRLRHHQRFLRRVCTGAVRCLDTASPLTRPQSRDGASTRGIITRISAGSTKVKLIRIVFLAAALCAANAASAAGVGVRIGTTGIGGDVAFGLVPTLSARVGYSYLSFNTTI